MIRPVQPSDAPALCGIYNHYVEHTIVTFEELAVSPAEMSRRIEAGHRFCPWLAAQHDGGVAGYAYAAPWKARSGYRFTVESTVYVSPDLAGRGFGTALYGALLSELRARGLHCVVGGIALPNAASIAMHEKLGFRKVAHFRETGWKLGKWVDVGYWQLMLTADARPEDT